MSFQDNAGERLWTMRNGYALCTATGLATIAQKLHSLDANEVDELRDRLRIGLHTGVQVTDAEDAECVVSQAFCSALPISYTGVPAADWKPFAALVLEGAYEATLWAGVLNAHRFSSRTLFLTQLGGGAFGNEPQWIHDAMRRALQKVVGLGLDVRIVSYGAPDRGLERLAREFA